jgi:hypothetical protein
MRVTTYEDPHAAWVVRVSAHGGPEIRSRFDPATRRKINFHRSPWLRWNPHDADVAWALDHYRDGIDRRKPTIPSILSLTVTTIAPQYISTHFLAGELPSQPALSASGSGSSKL